MSSAFDPRFNDPRDRDNDSREVEVHWTTLGRGAASERRSNDDAGDGETKRERARDHEPRPRARDPRDVFLEGLELPRGPEREVVLEGDRRYELNGEESRALATVGAFRVVPERDLRNPRDSPADPRDSDLSHLADQGLIRAVSLDGRERAVMLTNRGRRLLEAHRRDRQSGSGQAFHAGVSRPRELTHDASLYRAYLRAEERLREQGAEVRRVILEQDLKRDYQVFLQEPNRGRSDSDGRPTRDAHEIEEWARDHELPYFDDRVHFPDVRIEYELDGRWRHEDIEVVTEHYRGAHAANRARTGFSCHGSGASAGGRPFDPRFAKDFL
jgi:hypothetical protein